MKLANLVLGRSARTVRLPMPGVFRLGLIAAVCCSCGIANAAQTLLWEQNFDWVAGGPSNPTAFRLLQDQAGQTHSLPPGIALPNWPQSRYEGVLNDHRRAGTLREMTTQQSAMASGIVNDRFSSVRNELTYFLDDVSIRSATDWARYNRGGTNNALVAGRGGYITNNISFEPNAEGNAKIAELKPMAAPPPTMHVQFDVAAPRIAVGATVGFSVQSGQNYVDNLVGAENGTKSFFRLGFNAIPPGVPGVSPDIDKPSFALQWYDRKVDGMNQSVPFRWDDGTMMPNSAQTGPIIPGDWWMTVHIVANSSGMAEDYVDPCSGDDKTLGDNNYSVCAKWHDGANVQMVDFLDNVDAQTEDIDLEGLNYFLNPTSNNLAMYMLDNVKIYEDLPMAMVPFVIQNPVPPIFGGFLRNVPEPSSAALLWMVAIAGALARARGPRV